MSKILSLQKLAPPAELSTVNSTNSNNCSACSQSQCTNQEIEDVAG